MLQSHRLQCICPSDRRLCLQLSHGTKLAKNANNIARNGPDFNLVGSANGHACGRGFYGAHSSKPELARSYAGAAGAVCVCSALCGKQKVSPTFLGPFSLSMVK